jgi:hypothetical protein
MMQLPAGDVAAKLIGWMRAHPEYSEKDWVDCLDDAIATLKLCKSPKSAPFDSRGSP